MDGRSLELRFAALRRRVMLLGSVATLGWIAVLLVVLGVLAAWFDLLWELTPAMRIGCDVLLVVAAALVLVIGLWRGLARTGSRALARRLDRSARTGGQILSGYELSRVAWQEAKGPPLTHGLANIAVSQAASLAGGIPARDVVPWSSLRRMQIWLGVAASVVVGLLALCPVLTRTELLRFGDPFGDHPPYSNIVFHVEPGDTRVLYGSGLDVVVTTEGPAPQRVELVLRGAGGKEGGDQEEVLPMFQSGDGQWRTVLARVTADAQYFARARRARSPRFAIEVITIPKLTGVQFRVEQPEYARRAVYEGAMPEGGVAGLAGSQVQVWAQSNRPLARGSLVMTAGSDEQKIALEPVASNPDTVTGTFEIRTAGRFEIGVTDIADHDSHERFSGSVVVLPDEKPFIRIMQPPAKSLATPNAALPVVASGEDDCGIATMQLYRSLNDSRSLPLDLDVPRPSPMRLDGGQVLPLAAYELEPGDIIKLFARVEDNDPSGAKGAETPIATVQIISQEDFERMQRMREGLESLLSKYRQADRRLEALQAELEELRKEIEAAEGKELSPEAQKKLAELVEQLRRDSQELQEAADHLLPFDLDKNLVERLDELAKSLGSDAKELTAGDPKDLDREEALKRLQKLAEQLAEKKKKFDSGAMDPLAQLELVFPLIEDQSRFVALYLQQRDLADRLSSLKGMDENNSSSVKARMRSLEEEQSRLREELGALLDDIETHAARLPDDPELEALRTTAQRFAEGVRASGASEAMTDAETGLARFSGTDGHAGAKRAADILQRFLGQCKECEGKGRGYLKFCPGLGGKLGDTIDQLLGEAGLGNSGWGMGQNGYSMGRNSLNNVGLYGHMPGMERAGGGGKRGDQRGPGAGKKSPGGDDDNSSIVSGENRGQASGAAAETVPPRYRGRVGAYFRRIAEETPAE